MTDQTSKTIMVIDDDDIIRELLQSMLNRMGYQVILTASGEEALKKATQEGMKIDALILDLFLPDIRGDRLCPEMTSYFPDLKIIMMSGYGLENTDVFGTEIHGFLQKPGSYAELSSLLESVLD